MGLHIENELFVYNKVNDFYFYVQLLDKFKVNESKNIVHYENMFNEFKKLNIKDNNLKHILLIDKYKPTHHKEICGNENNIKKIINWFLDLNNNKNKCMLLSGTSGIGKTLSIELICNFLRYDIIYYDNNDIDFLIKRLLNKPINNKKEVLILDGIDFVDKYELDNIINTIKKINIKTPLIFVGNIKRDKLVNIIDFCYNIDFMQPSIEEIKKYIKNICFKENIIKSDYEIIKTIIFKNNDIRAIINDITFYNNIKSDVKKDVSDVKNIYNQIVNNKKISFNEKLYMYYINYEQLNEIPYNYSNNMNIEDISTYLDILTLSDTFSCKDDKTNTILYKSAFNISSINCLSKK